jgi:hypothetical protein
MIHPLMSSTIGFPAMQDGQNNHQSLVVVYVVEDAVIPNPNSPSATHLTTQFTGSPRARIVRQLSNGLDDAVSHLMRKSSDFFLDPA